LNDLVARVTRVINGADDLITQLTALQGQLRRTQGAGAPAPAPPVLADIEAAIKDLRHFRDSVLARPIAGLGLPSVSATA